jgi:predicted DNA-binding transcriptional regulator YafY
MKPASVWEVLQKAKGIKNAITISEISDKLGMSRRRIEHRISILRDMGAPIVSNCSSSEGPLGMYLARNDSQVQRWEKQMMARIRKVSHHRKRISNKF